jgi:hypothetical protein
VRGDLGPAVVVVEPGPRAIGVRAPELDEVEPNDQPAQAQRLVSSVAVRGALRSALGGAAGASGAVGVAGPTGAGARGKDVDWYRLVAPGAVDGGLAVTDWSLELVGDAGARLALELCDGGGRRLLLLDEGGSSVRYPNWALASGQELLLGVSTARRVEGAAAKAGPAAGSAAGAVDGAARYQLILLPAAEGALQVGAVREREPNDDPKRATVVGDAHLVTGLYGRRRDEDWLALSPPVVDGGGAPGTLQLQLSAVDGVAPELRVRRGSGEWVRARGSNGGELRLRNVGAGEGAEPLLVLLRAAEGAGGPEARWLLSSSWELPLEGTEREPNDSPRLATAMDAASGEARLSGFLWPGDEDHYLVTGLGSAAAVQVELDGVPGVALSLRAERLDVPPAPGAARVPPGAAGAGVSLVTQASADGTLRLVVSGRPHDTAFDVPYTVRVQVK